MENSIFFLKYGYRTCDPVYVQHIKKISSHPTHCTGFLQRRRICSVEYLFKKRKKLFPPHEEQQFQDGGGQQREPDQAELQPRGGGDDQSADQHGAELQLRLPGHGRILPARRCSPPRIRQVLQGIAPQMVSLEYNKKA